MGDQNGDANVADGETPVHEVDVDAFRIDAVAVTNAAFSSFVEATGYRTEAESFGYSAVFHLLIGRDARVLGHSATAPWWLAVQGADWRHPGGRGTDILNLADHPVVHVSWNDASAYCAWAARRLPTEAEWEYASRAGRNAARYPWGDELLPDGTWRCNIWQGEFPSANSSDDGFVGTAPVRAFPPNDWGLYQTIGNVWEWCADVFDPNAYRYWASHWASPCSGGDRVIRGGSYLCHESYCNRYRNSARTGNSAQSSTGNTGFRTVSLAA